MSKTGRINHRRGSRGVPKVSRRISVRSVPREQPDLRKVGRALLAIALADIEQQEPTEIPVRDQLSSANQKGRR